MTEDDKKESNNEVTVERDDNMLKVTVGFSLLVASPYRGISSWWSTLLYISKIKSQGE